LVPDSIHFAPQPQQSPKQDHKLNQLPSPPFSEPDQDVEIFLAYQVPQISPNTLLTGQDLSPSRKRILVQDLLSNCSSVGQDSYQQLRKQTSTSSLQNLPRYHRQLSNTSSHPDRADNPHQSQKQTHRGVAGNWSVSNSAASPSNAADYIPSFKRYHDGYRALPRPSGGNLAYLQQHHPAIRQQTTVAPHAGDFTAPFYDTLQVLSSQCHWIYEFLSFLCVLDPASLHETIFLRGTGAQYRWSCSGNTKAIHLSALDLEIEALQDKATFEHAIEKLQSLGLLTGQPGPFNGRTFTITSQARLHIEQRPSNKYKYQAVRFISFVYPWVAGIEPLYVYK
jgi:hypothetical protein